MATAFDLQIGSLNLRLFKPSLEAMGGWLDALNGDAEDNEASELQTWINPWDSGLFSHMCQWDLTGLRVLDVGCGLGLAGVVAGLRGAASVCMCKCCWTQTSARTPMSLRPR
mgnify:CR=1 FL=1